MRNDQIRSLAKASSYRIFGTLQTIVIIYLITGNLDASVTVGFVEVIVKIIGYYIHERTWELVKFGKTTTNQVGSDPAGNAAPNN